MYINTQVVTALKSWKWQLTGTSLWYSMRPCIACITDSWTCGAACRHTIAPVISRASGHTYSHFPSQLRRMLSWLEHTTGQRCWFPACLLYSCPSEYWTGNLSLTSPIALFCTVIASTTAVRLNATECHCESDWLPFFIFFNRPAYWYVIAPK